MIRLASMLAVTLVLTGTQAFGQPVTIDSGSGIESFSGLGGTSTATPLTFDSFNTSLGTLDSVQVVLENVALSGSAYGTNTSNVGLPIGDTNGPEDIYLNLVGTLTVTSSGGINIPLHATDTADNYQTEVQPGSSTTTFTYTDVAATPATSNQTITTSLTSYEGTGTASVTVDVTPSHFGVTGSDFASADSTANYVSANYNGGATGSGGVEVYYTYTPVPEPAQAAALMIGFGLCLLVGRRFRRQ